MRQHKHNTEGQSGASSFHMARRTESLRHPAGGLINLSELLLTTKIWVCFWRGSPHWARASSFTRFLDHTRRTTVGRTPLDEWSARRRDLWQHTTLNRTNIHAADGIRTHNLSRWAAVDLRLRPRGHWNRQNLAKLLQYFTLPRNYLTVQSSPLRLYINPLKGNKLKIIDLLWSLASVRKNVRYLTITPHTT